MDGIEMRADSVRMQDRAIICDLEPVASLSSLASGNTNDEMVMEWPRCELGRHTHNCVNTSRVTWPRVTTPSCACT